jgi:hypothetical protein
MTDPVTITQADRIAAERMYRFVQGCMKAEKRHSEDLLKRTSAQILDGRWDKDESVQAFARHRIETNSRTGDAAGERQKIVGWLREQAEREGYDGDYRFQAGQFADKIERGGHEAPTPQSITPPEVEGELVERLRSLASGEIISMTLGDEGTPEYAEAFKSGFASAMGLLRETLPAALFTPPEGCPQTAISEKGAS